MLRHLRYLYFRLRYPGFADFAEMGIGIEARFERCRQHWEAHLQACRRFQTEALAGLQCGDVAAVLGCGRLLDLDSEFLTQKFSTIKLFDADPSAKRAALVRLARARNASFLLTDLSGVMTSWSSKLKSFLTRARRDDSQLAKALGELETPQNLNLNLGNASTVFSCNVLSQIPLFWRDRVHALVQKYWHIAADEKGDLAEPLQSALRDSMAKLQMQHLQLLERSAARHVILIFDRTFEYYNGSEIILREDAAPVPVQDAMSSFTLTKEAHWTWEVAPQGIEQPEYGCRHVVQALYFTR